MSKNRLFWLDYWNPTKMIEENVNLVVEEEKEDTILLVYDERMKKKTCGI